MLDEFNFTKIGYYHLENNDIKVSYTVKKTERKHLVYALTVGDKLKYIGATVQGFCRPLDYHKNKVMKDVEQGIKKECESGNKVSVFARTENLIHTIEGLELNIAFSLEAALIQEYKPEWNNFNQNK